MESRSKNQITAGSSPRDLLWAGGAGKGAVRMVKKKYGWFV